MTPYVYGELFYDTRYDEWNRNRYAIGVRFLAPAFRSRGGHQNNSRATPPHLNALGV